MSKPAILICDDEDGIRKLYQTVLEDLYDLTFAKDGLEALKLIKSVSFSLMLLDMKMPRVNGLEILKSVIKTRPELPVIVVTGYHSVEIAQEVSVLGAKDFLAKPCSAKQILEVCEKNLKR